MAHLVSREKVAPKLVDGDVASMILAEDSDPLELAQVAISRVANIASELGVELRRPVCGRLGAELLLLADYIDKASQDQEDQLRSRIFKLLRDVESICRSSEETKSSEKSRKNRFPILEAIGESVPGLEIYKKARAEIREGLAKLTAHPKFAEKTIEHFRGFTKPSRKSSKLDAGFNTSSTRKTSEPQYPRHVNELVYRTLREYAYCSCEVDGIREVMRKSHLARLLLQPPCEEFTRRNMYQFDLLFSSGPLDKEAMLRHWQDVELMVPDVNLKVKKHAKRVQRARFIDDFQTADYRITMNNSPTQRLSRGQFCRLIGLEANSRLCLSINDGELQHYFAPLKKLVEHTPGISLADTLKHYPPLTARMKLVLAYIIAYSVWQYYDSDWMKTKWSSETIQFIKEFEENRCGSCDPAKLFTWKPYLSVNFNDDDPECQEFNRLDGGVHNYPRIRALGILLVEIGIGAPLHNQSLKKGLVAQVNNDLLSARGYIKDPKMWRNLEFEQYRDAAAQCLDPAIFSLAPFDAGASPQESRDSSLRQRRNTLYDKVVFPLEDLLHGTKWMEDWTRIGPLDSPTKFPAFQQFFPDNDDIEDSSGKKKIEKKRKRTTTEKEALNWLLRMDHFNQEIDHFIAAGKLSQSSQPVRIAILDTGYDSNAPSFHMPNVIQRMKGWKDFVDGCVEAEDCHGHGTHLVSLILKCAPHAEVYVARVAKTPSHLLDSSQNVADAITWASRECQADVISMSLGFLDEQPCISNAIREVLFERKDSIIMLAAASNYGFNDGEMFPARHDSVISIRATNANGDFLSSNPPRNEHEDIEFGTLGLDVPSYWINSDIVHKSGSSISTAITAGLTGSLLGYIRSKPDDETSYVVKERALTRRGMQAIFRVLSRRTSKQGCFYLTPWRLMGKPDNVRWSKLVDALDEV